MGTTIKLDGSYGNGGRGLRERQDSQTFGFGSNAYAEYDYFLLFFHLISYSLETIVVPLMAINAVIILLELLFG